jgi:NADH-quinone oxidoreductase subunit M
LSFDILTTILLLPIAGLIIIAALPKAGQRTVRGIALGASLASLALSILMFVVFDRAAGDRMQFEFMLPWIPALNSSYHVGVDGLSMPLVLLTTLLGFLSVLVSWKITVRPREYFIWLLLLESSVIGVFCALDLVLFFVFWEIELIPMYFLISIWGSGRKEYSSIKYVIYTLVGSALMLAGFLVLYFTTGTMDMTEFSGLALTSSIIPLGVLFFLLIFGFAVKLPVFPLHTWLPDAHTDAPTAVSVMLAGVLLKMGGYGMIRLCVSVLPQVALQYAPVMCGLAIIGVLYGAAVTLRQKDLKKLIAYSSVSHMGYVLLGIFSLTGLSLTGAALQMFSHGIVTGLLFAMVGLVYEKTHTRDLDKLGGLARHMPVITVVFTIAGLASLGLPGTSGFAAEFVTFVGSFSSNAFPGLGALTVAGVFGVVITAGYILWMLQRTFYGPPREEFAKVGDATLVEKICIFTFVLAILLVGIYPAILTDIFKEGVLPIARMVGL